MSRFTDQLEDEQRRGFGLATPWPSEAEREDEAEKRARVRRDFEGQMRRNSDKARAAKVVSPQTVLLARARGEDLGPLIEKARAGADPRGAVYVVTVESLLPIVGHVHAGALLEVQGDIKDLTFLECTVLIEQDAGEAADTLVITVLTRGAGRWRPRR